jgi:hypothetical protein
MASQKPKSGEEGDTIAEFKRAQQDEQREVNVEERTQTRSSFDDENMAPEKLAADGAQFTGTSILSIEFLEYFSEWKHAKILLGDVHVSIPP